MTGLPREVLTHSTNLIMKSWRNLPRWFRGGLIAGGVVFLSFALTTFCEYLIVGPGYSGLGLECYPFAIPWISFWLISNVTSLSTLNYGITGIAIWFVVGSLVNILTGHTKETTKDDSLNNPKD